MEASLDHELAEAEADWVSDAGAPDMQLAQPAQLMRGAGSWSSASSDVTTPVTNELFRPLPQQVGPALSPSTSFGSSASRQQLLDQALRLSSLRESSGSGVAAIDSLAALAVAEDTPAGASAGSAEPRPLLGALEGPAADDGVSNSDPSVWETVFLAPAEAKQPWHMFEAGPMFAGEDELDAHAAAVLAAENDLDAMADAMEHAAAAVPLPSAVGSALGGGHPEPSSPPVFVPLDPVLVGPTLLGAPSPVIVVRRAAPASDVTGVTTVKPQPASRQLDGGGGPYWAGGDHLPRIPRCAPDSSLDSFETATGYDPPEMPGQGDWSADEADDSEASAPQTPRAEDSDVGGGGYGSEDEWTPACVRRVARRSRTSCTSGAAARGVGSQTNSPRLRVGHPAGADDAAGHHGRVAATRVRDIVLAFGSDADDDEAGPFPPQSSARRGAGGKRRRSPGGAAESHDSDGNPRHKRHNPWSFAETEALVDGVERCGGAGRWQDIKRLEYRALARRSAVDLKDKWRNLLRVAALPIPPSAGKGDKKREAPSAEILARVRVMAALGPCKARRAHRNAAPAASHRPAARSRARVARAD